MTLTAYSAAPDIATAYPAWLNWLNVRQASFQANCPLERATTYYFSTSGSNSNDGLTESTPKQTRAAAIALTGPGIRFRFKRGDTWRETGNWQLGDNVTVDDYGDTSLAKPVFDRFTVQHLAANNDWTDYAGAGNAWQVNEATDVAWVKLSAYPLTRPLQRVATAAACDTTTNSWAWVTNVLYINLGTDNPNDFDIDVCPSNDGESGVETNGDGSRVENIVGYGWGCHRTTTASQDQPFTSTGSGNETNLFVGCEGYYSGSHAMAHYQGSGSGGRSMWINCKGGYPKYAAGETVFNTYANTGSHETWFIGCEAVYGTLPSSDWTPATAYNRAESFFAHTTTGTCDFFVVYNCTTSSSNTYGPFSGPYCANPYNPTAADRTTYKTFMVNCTQTKSLGAVASTSLLRFLQYGIMYGNRWSLWPATGGTNALDGSAKSKVWMFNNYLTLDMVTRGNSVYALVNQNVTWNMYWYHNFIELTNAAATSASSFGMDYFVRTNSSYVTPGSGLQATGALVNNIIAIKKNGGGAVYYLGFANTSVAKNNVLYGLTAHDGVERGYNLTTSPLVTAVAPVLGTAHSSALEAGSTEIVLSHDINGKRRRTPTPDIGPVDHSSPANTDSDGDATMRFSISI